MENDLKRLHELLLRGKCCASALVEMALEMKGDRNEQLVEAVSALCGGLRCGLLCGALTGAACMINILAPKNAVNELVQELVEWFQFTYGERYGGINCADITENDPSSSRMRCVALIEATYLQSKRILAEYGCGSELGLGPEAVDSAF